MKKLFKLLGDFVPLVGAFAIIFLFWVFQTLKIGNLLDWCENNWIQCVVSYTVGMCFTKFRARKQVRSNDEDED